MQTKAKPCESCGGDGYCDCVHAYFVKKGVRSAFNLPRHCEHKGTCPRCRGTGRERVDVAKLGDLPGLKALMATLPPKT